MPSAKISWTGVDTNDRVSIDIEGIDNSVSIPRDIFTPMCVRYIVYLFSDQNCRLIQKVPHYTLNVQTLGVASILFGQIS